MDLEPPVESRAVIAWFLKVGNLYPAMRRALFPGTLAIFPYYTLHTAMEKMTRALSV